ncbi:MAG: hypothetical protein N2320_01490 [Candidatus Bipolaricaulota bacterium]|nr:hypothetical protein [Candidatus Bipolaricaulota bacterium]
MVKIAVVVLAAAVAGFPAMAEVPRHTVALEFVGGAVGGYAGGALGALALSWALSRGYTGWESLVRVILGAYLGFFGGSIAGASLGVIGVGTLLGVEGNVGLTVLGAAVGTGLSFGIGFTLQVPEAVLPFGPLLSAAGATAGFNVGARARR